MPLATALSFTERLCIAHDINRGHPPANGAERATREEILEYIDAFTVDKSPDHPTSAIAWDLQRTLGESEGRRMLLYASRRWDAKPLRARDIVFKWWWEDYEPQAWVDEYLVDVIRDWRSERDRLRERAIREAEKAEAEARIKRARERVRALERDYEGSWRPHVGKKWPDPEVVAFASLVGKWFDPIDQIESAIEYFEKKLEATQVTTRLAPGTPMPSNVTPLYSAATAAPLPDLIKTSAEFVQGFVPPEYLVDGVLQRRFCYSITAQTGVGKTTVAMLISAHVACGRPLGGLDVAKGPVLYFAGENPTDIQMRWLGLTQEMKMDPATADVHFIPGAMPLSTVAERITAEVRAKGLHPTLVVVDTAAAYFEGDDENSNTQAVEHARRMRALTELPGGPCVLILCHPTKRATEDDLIPRGGGAFLAEVDGNIALQKRESLVVASVQGKFCGREFSPLSFELKTVFHPILKDARGRDIPTVIAHPINETDKQQMAAASRRHEDQLLKAIYEHPGASLRALAVALMWLDGKGQPNAMKVSRAADVLAREKLVRKHRGSWQLTSAGEVELNKTERPASGNYLLNPAVTSHVTDKPPFPPIPGR